MSIEITEKYVILKRFLSVAYGLSESEIDTFLRILESKEGKDIDAISAELKISKSRTSIILKKLSDAGLVDKEKGDNMKGGRPKYVYSVNKEELKNRLITKSEELCKELNQVIKSFI
ncbi:TrmB family transcriptional regulator [Sulfolobus acidocaldarius SUSAZ]|nr:TrmB family transcriptional regulator [Sulfolobus acidocaldarius SUSAZ]